MLKGKEKVSGEYRLVFLAYNFSRAVTILGIPDLLKRVKAAFFGILALTARVERLRPNRGAEILGEVWRLRVADVARIAVRV